MFDWGPVIHYYGLLVKISLLCWLPVSLKVIFVIGIVVNYISRILLECTCFIEFIKEVEEKR